MERLPVSPTAWPACPPARPPARPCAEQAFSFPRRTVLLLGREKEGIPADLLALMHHTVEIPQLGVVRRGCAAGGGQARLRCGLRGTRGKETEVATAFERM
jgi:hypothetical protein